MSEKINYPLGDDFRNKEALSLEDNLELSQNVDSSHPVSIPVLPGISEHIPSTRTTNSQNQRPAKK